MKKVINPRHFYDIVEINDLIYRDQKLNGSLYNELSNFEYGQNSLLWIEKYQFLEEPEKFPLWCYVIENFSLPDGFYLRVWW